MISGALLTLRHRTRAALSPTRTRMLRVPGTRPWGVGPVLIWDFAPFLEASSSDF